MYIFIYIYFFFFGGGGRYRMEHSSVQQLASRLRGRGFKSPDKVKYIFVLQMTFLSQHWSIEF